MSRIVLTLLVRDEADIVADMLLWHLGQGVDHVVAMDNGSTDGTTEILEDFAAMGCLTRIDRRSDAYDQGTWTTEMAHLARDRLDADWVIPSDADEFWAPEDPARTLRDALAPVPDDVAMVECARVNLFAPWDDIARLGWREAAIWSPVDPAPLPPARLRDPAPLARPFVHAAMPPKAILRAGRVTRIGRGAHPHDIDTTGGGRASAGITIAHVPFRDPSEVLASVARIGTAIAADPAAGPDVSAKYRRWHAMLERDGPDAVLAEIAPGPEGHDRDRLSGRVRADTRLSDALRPATPGRAARLALAGGAPGPDAGARDALSPPVVVLLAGGTDGARAAVARRLDAAGVRPIAHPFEAPVDWPARIAAILRALGSDPSPALLAELRAGQAMHAGAWHGLLVDDPAVTDALPVWRALRAAGDLVPALVLLADADGARPDLEAASRDLPRLVAPSDRIAKADPRHLHAALSVLGLAPPLSVALAAPPLDTPHAVSDPALARAGWGLGLDAAQTIPSGTG